MTDIEERPPGPPLDQHMSILISSADRIPLLGLASLQAEFYGREAQESPYARRAIRLGIDVMLSHYTQPEREDIARRGAAAIAVLDERKAALAAARRAARQPNGQPARTSTEEPARA